MFDSTGVVSLGTDDDGGAGYCSLLTKTGLAAGTYYIKVNASSYADSTNEQFQYGLTVTIQ